MEIPAVFERYPADLSKFTITKEQLDKVSEEDLLPTGPIAFVSTKIYKCHNCGCNNTVRV